MGFLIWMWDLSLLNLHHLVMILIFPLPVESFLCIPVSSCLLIQCKYRGHKSRGDVAGNKIKVCQQAAGFEIQRNVFLFWHELLGQDAKCLVQHSEIIFCYHTKARDFPISSEIIMWYLNIWHFLLWFHANDRSGVNFFNIALVCKGLFWNSKQERSAKRFSNSPIFSLKIQKSWSEPGKPDFIKIQRSREFAISFDFES